MTAVGAEPHPAWTLDDAAALLDPPVTRRTLERWLANGDLHPIGQRPVPGRGRAAVATLIDPAELLRVHAARMLHRAATGLIPVPRQPVD